jgi:F-type H+-transporting ATPase subunit delta
MNESRISVRYSKALFQSALEKKSLERVNQDMILIREACAVPEAKELLTNPVIRPSKKAEVLHTLLEKELHPLTLALVDLVVKNGRERYLPAIARVFVHETMKYYGITESVLTTAVKIDPKIKNQVSGLIEKLYKTKVDLKENIDDTIIGGFILKVDDNYIDASIRNKLRKIRAELITGSLERRI